MPVGDGRQHDAGDAYVSTTVADGNRERGGAVGMHEERENFRYGDRALHDFAGAWRRAASRGECTQEIDACMVCNTNVIANRRYHQDITLYPRATNGDPTSNRYLPTYKYLSTAHRIRHCALRMANLKRYRRSSRRRRRIFISSCLPNETPLPFARLRSLR